MTDTAPPRFPTVTGRNLLGADVRLPAELAGSPRVVILAFRQWQQSDVDSWVPFLEDRVLAEPDLRFYEVPAISGVWSPTRRFIDGGMAAAIREREVLERTVTYYGDLGKLTTPLGIEGRERIAVLVLDDDDGGGVVWQGGGPFSEAAGAELEEALRGRGTKRVGEKHAREPGGPERVDGSERFEFEWNPGYRRLLGALGVGPSSAFVTVGPDRLVVRFGRWRLDTALDNVVETRITHDYAWYKAVGARLSFADRGVTFGTDTARGVCVCFREPVPALLPTDRVVHPAVTLTLAEPERFRSVLGERIG